MDWKQQIEDAIAQSPATLNAHTYRDKRWPTASRPVVLACDDGNDYVVKGQQAGRMIVNEQVISCLGVAMGAPVGIGRLVSVSKELIELQPADLGHITPGVSHGSLLIPDCSDRQWVAYSDLPENKDRFALLALLFGWVSPNDQQLIYHQTTPHLVHSVDHGHFFPNGPEWTIDSLKAAGPAQPHAQLMTDCQIRKEDLCNHLPALENITQEQIVSAVAAPHQSWKLTLEERIALAEFLDRRKTELLNHLKS